MAMMMAELEASASYEGMWTFMDSMGAEHGPHTVAELQEAFSEYGCFPCSDQQTCSMDPRLACH